MRQHEQRNRPWRWALVLGAAAGLLLGRLALAQTQPPANLTPFTSVSISGKASGSETAQTSAADYTVTFTLAPGSVLDPPAEALLLRLETEPQDPEPCGDVVLPAGCFFPTGDGSFAAADNCRVSVVAFKDELNYVRDLTPLLESFSATLQQVQGAWEARIVTTFTAAVAYPAPCAITFTVGPHGVVNVPTGRSDAKFRVGP